MQIFVRGSEETRTLDVEPSTPVAQLKAMLGSQLVLTFGGRPLEEGTLGEMGICDLATLDATARLIGGKVHGSLARAGKVKGQTPKVDKQEKKKKKTGRAKRRIQYNRRFVNVVSLPGGRKKGPNSNS